MPQQTGSWGELKSAYRLLSELDVTYAALSDPRWQATRQHARQADTVLFVQDTSELDFTAHRQTTGLGWTGNKRGREFLLHGCLTVRPTVVVQIRSAQSGGNVRESTPLRRWVSAKNEAGREWS